MTTETAWIYAWGVSVGRDVREGKRAPLAWRDPDGRPIMWRTSGKPFPRGYRAGYALGVVFMSDPTTLPADMLTIPGVRRYDTMTGHAAYAVDGPRGHFLVTPARRRGDWEVWRSDELRSRAWCQSAAAGVTTALRMAGAS